ncbi:hypothetical protein ACL02U_25135 [Streptomyces sp. MS06]|uniref:hypothetical protein n=1 Tax=Streptomyces sp. MS06 TaxID=3385974 RepID=UPI00399F3156
MTSHNPRTPRTAHAPPPAPAEEIAGVVQSVPGVAFLEPGLAARLRSAVQRTDAGSASGPGAGRAPSAGVRVTPGPGGAGGWHVDVRVVALSRAARTVDVARAVRAAVEGHLAGSVPGRPGARVTVTITGLV